MKQLSLSLIWLASLMMLLMALPLAAVDFGNHQVNFMGVQYNYPNTGQSTWYYEVISDNSGNNISHVTFGINTCARITDAGKWDGPGNFSTLYSGQGDPDPGTFPATPATDPTTGITGLKFDEGFGDAFGLTKYYYYTLDGNYAAESTTMAIKPGASEIYGTIDGPSPTCAVAPQDPIAVYLTSFVASRCGDTVMLEWDAETETNHAGYNVLRSAEESGNFVKLNDKLIVIGADENSKHYEFIDNEAGNASWFYKLEAVSLDGRSMFHGPISTIMSGVAEELVLPEDFELAQNYPNPFNPQTTIEFSLPSEQFVTLDIYDVRGTFIRRLVAGDKTAGIHSIVWDAKDQYGNSISTGMYIYRITAGEFTKTLKMILMK